MIKEACSHLVGAPWLGTIAILCFFSVFTGTCILAWCLSERHAKRMGALALEDESQGE